MKFFPYTNINNFTSSSGTLTSLVAVLQTSSGVFHKKIAPSEPTETMNF